MWQTKTNFFKIFFSFLVLVLGLSSCDLGEVGSLKVVNALQEQADGFGNFSTGPLMLGSAIPFYRESKNMATDLLGDVKAYALTEEEIQSVRDWKLIIDFLVDKIPDVEGAQTEAANAAYLGTLTNDNTTVTGVYVYEFLDDFPFTKEQVESANRIAVNTGEYYLTKDHFILVIGEQFLSTNSLSIDNLARVLERV